MSENVTTVSSNENDFWLIRKDGDDFVAVYGQDFTANPEPSAAGVDDKFRFGSLAAAVEYASKNYVGRGIIFHNSVT